MVGQKALKSVKIFTLEIFRLPYMWKVSMGESFTVSDQTVKVSPLKFGQKFMISM